MNMFNFAYDFSWWQDNNPKLTMTTAYGGGTAGGISKYLIK